MWKKQKQPNNRIVDGIDSTFIPLRVLTPLAHIKMFTTKVYEGGFSFFFMKIYKDVVHRYVI